MGEQGNEQRDSQLGGLPAAPAHAPLRLQGSPLQYARRAGATPCGQHIRVSEGSPGAVHAN